MNSDQILGKIKEIVGEIQENTGRIIGSTEQETLGYNLEFEGLTQRKKGEAKEAFEELVNNHFKAE